MNGDDLLEEYGLSLDPVQTKSLDLEIMNTLERDIHIGQSLREMPEAQIEAARNMLSVRQMRKLQDKFRKT